MLEVLRDGDGTWIKLDRAEKANALSAELVERLLEAVTEAIDAQARVLVLSGAGRSFCAGFDLSALDRETDATLAYRFLRIELLLQALHYAPLYTVALAHGPVAGAGADLFAACGKRIAAPGTTFRMPGIRFGILLGTGRLAGLIGHRSRALVAEQETIEAAEAARIGLVDTIAEPSQWGTMVSRIGETVGKTPDTALQRLMCFDRSDGDRDMGILARTLAEPGLKERICAYWQEARRVRDRADPDRA